MGRDRNNSLDREDREGPEIIASGPSRSAHYRTIERCSLRADGGKSITTRSLAASTGLGAHPAVLHVYLSGVVLALLPAQPARLGASLEGSPNHGRLELRLPGDDPTRRGAHIRAVEAHGDAAPHVADHLLAEARIGAGSAALGTVKACLYA